MMKIKLPFLKFKNRSNPLTVFTIDSVIVTCKLESGGLRLITDFTNTFLENQTLSEAKSIVENNYKTVKEHYKNKIDDIVSETDLESVCISIVLYYFQMHNLWRKMYAKERNRNLAFVQKDFDHPYTGRAIIDCLKKLSPDNYASKCAVLLSMTSEQFAEYAKKKKEFEDMW